MEEKETVKHCIDIKSAQACLRRDKACSDKVVTGKLDGVDSGELPQEFLNQWHRLSVEGQKKLQDYLIRLTLMDTGTVQVNPKQDINLNLKWKKKDIPFMSMPPEQSNTVRTVDKVKRNEQIEAVLQGIKHILDNKLPRGLVLDSDNAQKMQSPLKSRQEVEGCDKMVAVLGKGNSAGEITVFKNNKTGKDMALKTVMISQFNVDEVFLWVHLGDADMAPQLYHFELVNNKLYFTMEIMSGKDLQTVIDESMWAFSDVSLARDFSLCILHDLLKIWEEMRHNSFIHGDMHGGNLRLETSMEVKIFDFGRAKKLLKPDSETSTRLVKSDVVGIIRVFCALYSGYDFNNVFEAVKILESKNLEQLDEYMIRIPEENRKELYHIMNMLFDTVGKNSNPHSSSFGNLTGVSSYVQKLVEQDMTEIKKRAAVIIFPERFQESIESDAVFEAEGEVDDWMDGGQLGGDIDPIWDDPHMKDYVNNVSDAALQELIGF